MSIIKIVNDLEKQLNETCDLFVDNTWNWEDDDCFRDWKVIKRISTRKLYSEIMAKKNSYCSIKSIEDLSVQYSSNPWTNYWGTTDTNCYNWLDLVPDTLNSVVYSGNSMWVESFRLGLISGDIRDGILVLISPENSDFYAITGYEDIYKVLENNFIPALIDMIIPTINTKINGGYEYGYHSDDSLKTINCDSYSTAGTSVISSTMKALGNLGTTLSNTQAVSKHSSVTVKLKK